MVSRRRPRVGVRGFRGLMLMGRRRGFYIGLNARWGVAYRNFVKP